MRAAELHRLIANLIRLGTIAEVDHGRARVRVRCGELFTAWLPWATLRAGDTRDWNPPTVGEQVLLFSPGGDPAAGVVLAGIYSSANAAPSASPDLYSRVFPDGTRIDYDHATHKLTATVKGSAEIVTDTSLTAAVGTDAQLDAGGNVTVAAGGDAQVDAGGAVTVTAATAATVEAPAITLNGPTTVNGPLLINGPIAAAPGPAGSGASFQGDLQVSSGDVTVDGISVKSHVHPYSGGTTTGAPQQ